MASTDAKERVLWGVAHRIVFPIFDADGDLVTGATTPDSEVSKDQGTFADCTNEATEIATSSGMYYLDLTATEMETDCAVVIVKTATSGAKTTPIVLYTDRGIRSRKATAGAAGTITLDASASATDDFYNGCLIEIVGGTGVGQSRIISDYVGSTKVASVGSNWATNPDNTSVFRIDALPGVIAANTPTNFSSLSIDVNGRVDASKLAGQTITAAAGVTFPSSIASPTNITAGTITTVTNLTNAPTAGDLTETMKTSVQTSAAAALTAYDPPTNAEMESRTLASASYATASALATVDTVADAIKVKTDSLTFTVAGKVDANPTHMAGIQLTTTTPVGEA